MGMRESVRTARHSGKREMCIARTTGGRWLEEDPSNNVKVRGGGGTTQKSKPRRPGSIKWVFTPLLRGQKMHWNYIIFREGKEKCFYRCPGSEFNSEPRQDLSSHPLNPSIWFEWCSSRGSNYNKHFLCWESLHFILQIPRCRVKIWLGLNRNKDYSITWVELSRCSLHSSCHAELHAKEKSPSLLAYATYVLLKASPTSGRPPVEMHTAETGCEALLPRDKTGER